MAKTTAKTKTKAKTRAHLKIQLVIASALAAIGAALLIAGLVIPPTGEIHYSVLIAVGEILTFVGSTLGIDYHYKFKEFNRN